MSEEPFLRGVALAQWAYGAERLGVPAFDIMKTCRIDPVQALEPSSEIPLPLFENYLLELILASGDELFGLHIGQQIMPALYGSLSMLIMSAESVEDAVRLAIQYSPLVVGSAGGLDFRDSGDDKIFLGLLAYRNHVVRRHWIEAVGALLFQAFRFHNKSLYPEKIFFEHNSPSKKSEKEIRDFFISPIHFGASFNGAIIARKKAELRLHDYGKYSLEMARKLADEQLEAQKKQQDVIGKIKLHIEDLMGSAPPRRESVAERLGVSSRTLDRRLSEAGVTWQQLVDSIRSQLAHEYLAQAHYKIKDVASMLGFADVRAFQRRFRHWTGVSPSQYKKSLNQPGGSASE